MKKGVKFVILQLQHMEADFKRVSHASGILDALTKYQDLLYGD